MCKMYRVMCCAQCVAILLLSGVVVYVDWERRKLSRETEKNIVDVYKAIEEHQKITLAILKNDTERARRMK